jgi:methyl-accepting chemotaxis protein
MKNVQLKIAITNLVYMLLLLAVIVVTILSPLYLDISQSIELCGQYFSAKMFIVLLERLAYSLVILLILAFIHQIVITHKICGPLVNFRNTFNKISQGDLTRKIFLRRHDFLQTEAHQVNEMIDMLSTFVTNIKHDNSELRSTLQSALNGRMEPEKLDETLQKAIAHADQCNKHISKFKVTEAFYSEPN